MRAKIQGFARMATVLVWSCLGSQLQLLSVPACEAKLTVRVYDSTGMNLHVLLRAQKAADEVLKRAGVELHWVNCTFSPVDNRSRVNCTFSPVDDSPRSSSGGDPDSAWTKIRIVPKSMVNHEPLSSSVAALTLPTGVLVFFNRVRGFAQLYGFPEPQVLAAVMAHELGHVLLGQHHGTMGLMQGDLKPSEFRLFASGALRFTRQEAELIQVHLRSPGHPMNELPQPLYLPELGSRECGASAQ